jgi:hypothetical protein
MWAKKQLAVAVLKYCFVCRIPEALIAGQDQRRHWLSLTSHFGMAGHTSARSLDRALAFQTIHPLVA